MAANVVVIWQCELPVTIVDGVQLEQAEVIYNQLQYISHAGSQFTNPEQQRGSEVSKGCHV